MTENTQHLRLGLSKDILPYTETEVLDAEYNLSKFLVRSAQNTIVGLAIGTVASLFFKRKSIIFYSAGFGFGYTFFSTFTCCECKK